MQSRLLKIRIVELGAFFFSERRLSHKLAWLVCNNELLTGLCQLGSILAQLASAYLAKKLIPPDYLGYFLLILKGRKPLKLL